MRSKLGNAEAALDFLCELRDLKCGTALEQKMLSKSADLVRQFGKEVDAASMLFRERKACLCRPETQAMEIASELPPPESPTCDRSCSVTTRASGGDNILSLCSVRDTGLRCCQTIPARQALRAIGWHTQL